MKQVFTSDKSDKIMNKQQRQNPGRQASGTVTWPRQGRTSPRPFIPVPPDARLARRPPLPGSRRTEESKPTPCRPTPVPKSSGQERRQLPRAGKLETYLPRMRYTINGATPDADSYSWEGGTRSGFRRFASGLLRNSDGNERFQNKSTAED
ncbi:rho guanine nucleotide exchange factor 15-like [Mustela erminea]|uniref:rho guanine nucleotide exchange factor 15-like n=1 Tax=Mustela erminea TaxID=36723 RepID=UPI001386EBD2|nr:rho guanine nucleotide exchange factor 15-like [Mustela erminea]